MMRRSFGCRRASPELKVQFTKQCSPDQFLAGDGSRQAEMSRKKWDGSHLAICFETL
jgi:hypothetical protein